MSQAEQSGGFMETVKKILAPTDLSELSCVGLRHALEMGRSRGAEVIVYHVIEVGDQWSVIREDAGPVREMLERHARMLDTFLHAKFPNEMDASRVRQVVELGAAAGNIVEKAEREGIDRIVMSTHGRTGIDHLLLGSVSEKVIARAPCPVLVVPAHRRSTAHAA
jgi:nucleotide-binding universal stress UspA family protein